MAITPVVDLVATSVALGGALEAPGAQNWIRRYLSIGSAPKGSVWNQSGWRNPKEGRESSVRCLTIEPKPCCDGWSASISKPWSEGSWVRGKELACVSAISTTRSVSRLSDHRCPASNGLTSGRGPVSPDCLWQWPFPRVGSRSTPRGLGRIDHSRAPSGERERCPRTTRGLRPERRQGALRRRDRSRLGPTPSGRRIRSASLEDRRHIARSARRSQWRRVGATRACLRNIGCRSARSYPQSELAD